MRSFCIKAHAADILRQGLAATSRNKYARLHAELLQAFPAGHGLASIQPEDLRRHVLTQWTQAR